ncbi:auxilin-like protein 1 [Neltuma alba]|uniref:auxilin-like protein 1 n=1 Tax=Neltuma alba TaxID=207710 RepID=UPI0010A3538F|nr:auxilin-like protein 1 [Prosopis alba]
MDFGAVTAKKFSNGYGVPGKSAYDGVFASPVKFRAPSLASSFEDYCEIFGGSEATIGSSIPVLEVPELNETKNLLDVQRSKLDYSKVFGGFGNPDTAVPYEELFAEPKKKDSFHKRAPSQDKGGNLSSQGDSSICSNQVPRVSQETSYGAKKINMSYHKINQGSENINNGTTHIAQLHAVPAYTCLVEEVNPLKINKDEQSIPELQHAYPGSDYAEGIKEREYCTKSVNDPSPDSSTNEFSKVGVRFQDGSDSINMFFNASEVSRGSDSSKKLSSNGGVKVQESSDSISMFLNACEGNHGNDGTDYIEVPKFQTVGGNLDDHGHAVRSVAAQCRLSASEAAASADSPGHLDDMIDSSSEAAASVAALRKAIEEAQQRLKVAKDLMQKKKEGFPNHVKRRLNNDLKAEGKKEDEFVNKAMRHEGTSLGQTCGEMDVLQRKSSVTGKPMMRKEQITLDLRAEEMFVAKDFVRGPEKLESTLAEHIKGEEGGHKEAAHEETHFDSKDAENNKEVLYTVDDYHLCEKNAGKNAFGKQEEPHQPTEVVEGPCEPEANEEKINVDDEAGDDEELVDKKMFMHEELVDDTKLAQETPSGAKDKNLELEDEPVTDDKVAPFLEQEDSERTIGEEGKSMVDEKKIKCKSEDEEKVEGPCEQEECSRKLRDHQEFIELKKNDTQEEIESEEKVESFSRLKEFELREDMKSIESSKPSNIHDSCLIIMERQMENWSFVEEQKKMKKAVLLALNHETEHHYQREGNENRFGNIHMQEILEDILGHTDDEEEFHEVMLKDSDFDRGDQVEDAKEDEMEIKGATYLTEETEKHSSEPAKICEEKKTEEADRTREISPNNELDGDNSSKIEVAADTTVECGKIPEVTPEEYSLSEQDEILVASNASPQHEEKCNGPESLEVINNLRELELTSTLAQGALQHNEAMNQMQHANETVSFDSAATDIGDPHENAEQNPNDCWEEAEDNCNLAMPVEEPSPELRDVFKYMEEDEDGLKAKIDENRCNSSYEEILVDNESSMEASQPPLMPEWKSSTFGCQEIEQAHSNLKKNYEAALTMEEKKADETSQKLKPDVDHLKKNEGAKEKQRERERDKEKIAVERAIREARERAFAEARERAALEKAAAEARRKNVSDGRERLVKTTGQANEKTSTERAAMEAKLKAERAAVERATAEARARALERALSEKAASEWRNKSDKFSTEKSFGASRDNGMKTNFHSKSFSYGDTFDGANGDSAQRCKARSERHQRIGERVAKALAEKNARDRLVQKEQEERNRVAEALDGDVKRWSGGKEGNLRALLSTLQYILGPDSGWQPTHLTDIVSTTAVKKAYRKATLFVHPDKLQQRGASIQQKYICEKVFDLLKEAWNKFNMEER